MDRNSAKTLITNTLCNKFDKTQYRNFIINFLDGIDENKVFTCGNAYVPEAFRDYITSYGRFGKYTDKNNETIEVLWVSLKKDTSLDRARTIQRNFVAWYLNGGRGGQLRKNALVAFYNEDRNDWRFSFVKLDTTLIQDDKGKIKIVNNFTPAKRFSFLVGEFEPNHTAQSRLVSLLEKDYPTLDEIEEAFNVEKVSKEFFENYKELFLQLTEDLKNIRENESSQRINAEFTLKSISDADFCKKLLGQLVFLYFIQKKGWLGVARDKKWGEGDKQFLRHTFERAIKEGKNFFNDYLEPLFYNALANGERDDNWFGELDCKIPFLNGGLFERYHDYDWVNTDIVFDNTIFSNNKKTKNGDIGTGILDVFDRYNFTVKEDEPLEKEVAVDPEMLGKVFENLLEVQDRKSKGAFYTPREIVHYMCQESLINYLCTELGVNEENNNISDFTNLTKQDIEDFIHHSDKISQLENIATDKENENSKYKHIFSDSIKNNAKAIDKALEDIKICDPAIGSGAFPVGMLNEIVRARIALVESGFLPEAKKRTNYEYKRQAIQNSIYGVDIESGAVEIAKLRLWLSLVVDEEDIENIKALPNLDYKIVCGNSLLGVERNLFNDALFKQLEELKPQFFNETRKSEKRRLKKQIDATIKELTKEGTFDFKIYFSEVFHEKGGFDVVIGNPPYVKEYTDRKAFDELRLSLYYQGKMDLWYFFGCKGLDILKQKGVQTFIAPNNWMTNAGASIFRNKLLKESKIVDFVDFGNYKVFDTASIQTMVYLLCKSNDNQNYVLNYSKLEKDNIDKNELELFLSNRNETPYSLKYQLNFDNSKYYDKFITFLEPKINNLVLKIKTKGTFTLADNEVAQGIVAPQDFLNKKSKEKLGNKHNVGDGVFALTNSEKMNLNLTEKENEDLIRPLFSSNEISRYYSNKSNQFWLIYTNSQFKNKNKIEKYPNIKKHLDNYKDIITSDNRPYGLHRSRDEKFFKDKKIISLRKCSKPSFTYTNFSCYVLQTFFVIKTQKINLKYLTGVLNSKLIEFWLRYQGKMQGDNFQIDKEPLMNIPIYKPNQDEEDKIVAIVDKIYEITNSEDYVENKEKQDAVKEYEKQIDIMVYKLYDLTYQEVLIIDKDFSISEEEYNIYKYRNMQ